MNIAKAGKELMRSKWMGRAGRILADPVLLRQLIQKGSLLTNRKGLNSVRMNLLLMLDYLQDIALGRYKGYNATTLLIIVAAVVYVVSPLDLIPDFLIIAGWTDDISIIAFAMGKGYDEFQRYKKWKTESAS